LKDLGDLRGQLGPTSRSQAVVRYHWACEKAPVSIGGESVFHSRDLTVPCLAGTHESMPPALVLGFVGAARAGDTPRAHGCPVWDQDLNSALS
jgi:hypothetical protein